ncbi:MAG: hypothetical protein V1839_02960 [archaeon]
MNGEFCPKCGTLLRKDESCRGCKRGIKRTTDLELLEDKVRSAFKNDKRVAGFLPRMHEHYTTLLNSRRCIRGRLYDIGGKPLMSVIMDVGAIVNLKMVTVNSGKKYFEVPESVVLFANYVHETGKPEMSYLLAIPPRDYWLYKRQAAHYKTPSANPLARFIVPSDFDLAEKITTSTND